MLPPCLELDAFLRAEGAILDVRSPGEFSQGQIPGAFNLPLLSNEERVEVGTAFKQQGQEAAMAIGLRIVGPKLDTLLKTAKTHADGGPLRIHCWRGGMRSQSVAQMLTAAGIPSITLRGGYKSYRRWALEVLREEKPLCVLGGMTGSGKTRILHALKELGEQVIDLEAIAKHRGSSFGMLGQAPQPSCEQFENEIALQWQSIDSSRPCWIEDESRMVGRCAIPNNLFDLMRKATVFVVNRPLEERLKMLLDDYSSLPAELLEEATRRIEKRLGGQRTKEIIELGRKGCYKDCVRQLLNYYDKSYYQNKSRRKQDFISLVGSQLTDREWAQLAREKAREIEILNQSPCEAYA